MPFNQRISVNWFHHLWNKPAGGRQDRDKSSRRGEERKAWASRQLGAFLLLLFEWLDDFPLYKVVIQITTRGLISIRRRAIRRPEFNVSWKCSQAFVILFPSSSLLPSCPWMPQTLLSQLQASNFYPSIKDAVKERKNWRSQPFAPAPPWELRGKWGKRVLILTQTFHGLRTQSRKPSLLWHWWLPKRSSPSPDPIFSID